MKGHHDIYIMKVGNEYRVRPTVVSSDGQGGAPALRLRNLTDKKVVVALPRAILRNVTDEAFVLEPMRLNQNPLAKDSQEVKLKKRARADVPGVHPFSVFVIADGGPVAAAGESEPIIIIDPPPA